ncbi:sarcosine oxidase, partial [Metarhizium majus ARSEF 297]
MANSAPVLIVGAGAFGLSTALHLSRAGYTDITVLDKDDTVPSRYSAANDLNKIVRAEYEDAFYTELALSAVSASAPVQKAMSAWRTPLFAPYYHQTGFLHCVSETASEKAVATMQRFRASAEQDAQLRRQLVSINTRRDILHHVRQFHDGPLPGWRGYLNRCAGYAQSGHALAAVHRHLCQSGVRFRLGPGNQVVGISYEAPSADGSGAAGGTARGVETANGAFYPGRLVVVAAGAWAAQLVPELGSQVVARCWSVAHVQLTDEEASALRGIPVTYARDLGFFFEPDPGTKLLKLCPMGAGIVNTDGRTGVSLPPGDLSRSAFMPGDDEGKLRRLLAHTLPALAERPLVKRSLCWFADTSDSDYIVDYVPGTRSSVVVLSGDSGHGFKMFPIVGSWVADLLRAADGRQHETRWRWKHREAERSGSHGGNEVSWRVGETRELSSVEPTNPGL